MTDLFRNTLGPAGWTLMALVPPAILALYFLRLRRQPVEVPSTYLWARVIEDLHVNSLWQKLRRNLLLWLQLLAVGLAIVALLRPGWRGTTLTGQRFIFLVDRSASMSTRDADGRSRLEVARQRALQLVDQMDGSMSAMILAFDDEPQVMQPFTTNRRLLREAIGRIAPTSRGTSVRGALELARGLAIAPREQAEGEPPPAEPIEVYILSDGRFGDVAEISLENLRPKFLPIGGMTTNNLALTALATRRNELRPELRQAFVQAANFSDEPCVATVSLRLDGALVDARDLRIPAGEVAGATFSLGERAAGALEARLEPPAAFDDRLSADNVAYAVLDSGQAARILVVTPGNNRAMLAALATGRVARLAAVEQIRPEQLADDAVQRQLQAGAYSLAVFDQCAPASAEQMPRCNTLFVGRAPPTAAWQESVGAAPAAGPQIIDWHRAHPLLHLVELGNVAVVDSLIVTPPAGGQVLVDSTRGPLAAIAPRESYEDAVLGFEIVGRTAEGAVTVNTNWPRRHSFPNFWLNVVQYLAGGAAESQAAQLAPGATAEIVAPRPGARLTVTLPDGSTRRLDAPAAGPAAFRETDQLGVYQVRDGDQPVARLAVNLFDRQESDVRLRAEPVAGGGAAVAPLALGYADVPAQAPNEAARRELWTPLLLAVLGVLTLEWYIYNRRVYV